MCKKKIMETFRLAEWFEATRGLPNKGLDVLRLSKRDVSKEELAPALFFWANSGQIASKF